MEFQSFNLFEGKKRKKIKPLKLKTGRRVTRYSRIDQWLKVVQELIKDVDELEKAKKRAEEKMKKIKKRDNTKSLKKTDTESESQDQKDKG